MTKKYWADWQMKVYTTTAIYLKGTYREYCYLGKSKSEFSIPNDKIIEAIFNGDNVDLVIERYDWTIKKGNFHVVVENEYKTLNRLEILRVEFK